MDNVKKSSKNTWNPEQYNKFEQERILPFYDLLNLILPKSEMSIVDLGCGTGKLTEILCKSLGVKKGLGIDSSSEMLNESNAYKYSGLQFQLMKIEDFKPKEKFDLVFSNAALQWLPDHFKLFTQLSELLNSNGQLAIHIPANYDYPAHVIASNLARETPFKEELNGEGLHNHVLTLEEYSKLLYELGFEKQIVRMQVYAHLLESTESIIEWVKGSLLTYYQGHLSPEKYELFFKRYREKVFAFFGDTKPIFMPFKRILIWAQR